MSALYSKVSALLEAALKSPCSTLLELEDDAQSLIGQAFHTWCLERGFGIVTRVNQGDGYQNLVATTVIGRSEVRVLGMPYAVSLIQLDGLQEPKPEQPKRDDAEERFSLLEID